MEPGGDGDPSGVFWGPGRTPATPADMKLGTGASIACGAAGVYLLVAWRGLVATPGVLVQQLWASAICALPHWSLMWRQQSCSALVISCPGRAQANSGADPSNRATNRQTGLRIDTTIIV